MINLTIVREYVILTNVKTSLNVKQNIEVMLCLTTGGHEDFKKMQQLAIDEYNMCETLGSQKETVLHEYLVRKENAEQVIINADIVS